MTVLGGSDIEMEWDPYSNVSDWLQGFYNSAIHYGSSRPFIYDYGDACQNSNYGCTSNGWNLCTIYQVAWGYGYDEPVPEIYGTSQPGDWHNVQANESQCQPNAGLMQFEGIANESWPGGGGGLSWQQALSDFLSALGIGSSAIYPDTCFPAVGTHPLQSNCY